MWSHIYIYSGDLPTSLVSVCSVVRESKPVTLLCSPGQYLKKEIKVELQQYFAEEKYPSAMKKEEIAQKLGLDYTTVNNWFKSERVRREKPKRLAKKSKWLVKSRCSRYE